MVAAALLAPSQDSNCSRTAMGGNGTLQGNRPIATAAKHHLIAGISVTGARYMLVCLFVCFSQKVNAPPTASEKHIGDLSSSTEIMTEGLLVE